MRKPVIRGKWIAVLILIAVLFFAGLFVYSHYRVQHVFVQGNTRYSNEEIEERVLNSALMRNTLYLKLRYGERGVEGIPFVDRVDIDVLDDSSIRLSVYEKALAGYISYLGRNLYFDRDGTVIESSLTVQENVPQITGLTFDQVVLYEKLPVEDDAVFHEILEMTQLLSKYELSADKIYFDSANHMTLFFGGIRVILGDQSYMDEKISSLHYIIPNLSGKEGSIDMSGYTSNTRFTTFTEKKNVDSN